MGGCLSSSSSSYDSKVNSRRVSSSSSLLSHENSGGTLASERINNLQHQLDECKRDLDHANGKIRDLHSVIEDKTKELELIRGERLEWQIAATNAVVTHDHHDKHRQGQRRSNDEEDEEVIKLKNELMKANAKWREMLKREREIRNAYERILINIGYMPNEITAGVVHVVKNILMNTHEHRRMAELQLITAAAAEVSNSNEEQCDDNEIDENMVDDGDVNREGGYTKEEEASSFVVQSMDTTKAAAPVDFRLPLPAGSLHWQRTAAHDDDVDDDKKGRSSVWCHIDWKAAVRAASVDAADDNGLYNTAMRLAKPNGDEG
ncbi:hypothetical protein FOZ62_005158 [Perkinsus olseni]|uniref:Uncharacterized protein n=1 Tax=Perkinsus olseni TaxID=32597 RepID=A0A7J6SMF4_PEROL|nr:hypothetical protein FOZ62_005158 [Perkinsus olseni]